MAKFKFRLQSYLNVKTKIEDQRKLEFGKATQKLETEKAIQKELYNESANTFSNLKNEINEGITPLNYKIYNQYIGFLDKKIRKQNLVVNTEKINVEKKRNELVEAMKQRKIVDKLKEKDYVVYLEEEAKAEQKITDEIVSYRYTNTISNEREE